MTQVSNAVTHKYEQAGFSNVHITGTVKEGNAEFLVLVAERPIKKRLVASDEIPF